MIKQVRLSLVQVLILAVALGVIAKVVAPQFSQAGTEERVSRLIDGLSAMRMHLDLYRVWHRGSLPPTDSFASFERAITTKAGEYVPYLEEVPANPFNGLRTVRFDGVAAGANEAGWRLDTATGMFQADNDKAYAGF